MFPLLEEVCYKQPDVLTADKTDVDWLKINILAAANVSYSCNKPTCLYSTTLMDLSNHLSDHNH